MTNPIQIIEELGSIGNLISNVANDRLKIKEQHKTMRLQTKMNATISVVETLHSLIANWQEYRLIKEEEEKKRQAIDVWKQVELKKIKAQRDAVIHYLELAFDERAKVFDRLFQVVDEAIEAGNNEQLAVTLQEITNLAQSSPFKDLSNLSYIKTALNDPAHKWEI